ncbi:hypothetical protein JX265_010124 [Neoarthrinium moseri]|uniref:Uncharacterized protein n=1 Tax=Neoarthrinium moseri TaxID=1658444 RepID=A0A9Q0AIS7_9PEZI|nr:hypothetical protein JX265_010124 [Neoarthrinium moseri]
MSEPSNTVAGEISQSRPDERSPLLAGSNDGTPSGRDEHEEETAEVQDSASRPPLAKWMKWLMMVSCIDALLAIFMVLGISITLINSPRHFTTPWRFNESYSVVIASAVIGGLSSVFNALRLRRLPTGTPVVAGFFTLLADAVVIYTAAYGDTMTLDVLNFWSSSNLCRNYMPGPGPDPVDSDCERFAQSLKIVVWVYFCLLLIFGVVHFVLLILRLVSNYRAFRSPRGEHISQLRLPSWNFSVEFTIKYRSIEEGDTVLRGGVASTAGDA